MDDWNVGDLAECIDDNWGEGDDGPPYCPVKGRLYRVTEVESPTCCEVHRPHIYLCFGDVSNDAIFISTSFRKVTPRDEPCSEEFRAMLKDKISPRIVEPT